MVFVLNKNKKPVNMCHEATARILLKEGKAVVHKYYPFTIRLKNKVNDSNKKEYCLKIDPGSKFTGLAIVTEDNDVVFVVAFLGGAITLVVSLIHNEAFLK